MSDIPFDKLSLYTSQWSAKAVSHKDFVRISSPTTYDLKALKFNISSNEWEEEKCQNIEEFNNSHLSILTYNILYTEPLEERAEEILKILEGTKPDIVCL